jgi:multiple antibiotic resistance protein
MNISQIFENTFYFLALINPASKILFLSTKDPAYKHKELVTLSLKSSLVAWLILILLTFGGNFILLTIFHVEIYSLSVAGGVILFIIGLNAVRKGNFYERKDYRTASDVSIVPLAAPLIAGPGVMTAAIFFATMHGIIITLICVSLAIVLNLLLMLSSAKIGHFLEKVNATGPLIRITGLIVTAVAMQMVFNGFSIWLQKTL